MKKLFSLLTVVALTFAIVGCGSKKTTTTTTTVKTQSAQELLLDAKDSLVLAENGTIVESNITLPTLNGYTLTWESSHPEYLSNTGVVTRPDYSVGNVEVTLTATIADTINNLTESKAFKVTVKALEISDEQVVANAKEAIKDAIPAETETNLTLPTVSGVDIQWSSSHENIISSTGVVTIPTVEEGVVVVTLTATLTKGQATDTLTFEVKVAPSVAGVYGHVTETKEQLPYTFKLSTEVGAELVLPYGNVNKDRMYNDNLYAYVYLPTFGANTPSVFYNANEEEVQNAGGVAYVVVNDVITAVYDGISGKKYDAENQDGVAIVATANSTNANEDYYKDLVIPEGGYVVIFFNGNDTGINGLGFATTVLGTDASALGKKLEMTGLNTTSVGVALKAQIHWRGEAEVTVPFIYIDPRITIKDDALTAYSQQLMTSTTTTTDGSAPNKGGTNVTMAFPLIFTELTTKRQGSNSVNLNTGYAISTVLRVEPDELQTMALVTGGDEYTFTIPFKYEIARVYDGIAGQIKHNGANPEALAAEDSAKNMIIEDKEILVCWLNSGVNYSFDKYNRRVAADYFYAPNGWVTEEYVVDQLAETGSVLDTSDAKIEEIVNKILSNLVQ